MKKSVILGSFVLLGALLAAGSAAACPACQEAVVNASGKDDDDPLREARAYNNSIYLMVSMPYAVLGTIGVCVYRGYRTAFQKALAEQRAGAAPPIS